MGRAAVRPGGKEPPAQLPDGVDVRLHAVPFPGAGSRIGWQPVARWTTSWTASPRRPPRQLGAVAPTNRGRAARQPARWTSTAVTTAHASSRCTSASVRAWDRRVGATAPMRWYAACQRTEKESLGVCRPARPWRRSARAPNGLHQRDQVGAGHPEHPGRRRARPQSARGCLHQRDGAVHEGPVRVGLGRGPCLCDRVTGQLGPAVEADYPPVAEHPRRERGPSRDTPVPRRPSRARPGCGSRETLLRWFMNVLLL